MNHMDDIRKRIKNRRALESEKPPFLFRMVYKAIMFAMFVGVFALALTINHRLQIVDLSSVWNRINFGLVSQWLPFESWFEKESTTVSQAEAYTQIKENQYTNNSNQATLIMDGVVLHVEQKEGLKGNITIRHDNGVIGIYGNLDSIQVKQDERLLKGSILGTYQSYLTLDLRKDQTEISYQDAFE